MDIFRSVGMWPSLVGHCVRDAGVARSNRAIPTISVMRTDLSDARTVSLHIDTACYPTTDAILNMGRYMAIIIPPTTPPRNTIMNGSSSAVMASTAASTSSS